MSGAWHEGAGRWVKDYLFLSQLCGGEQRGVKRGGARGEGVAV